MNRVVSLARIMGRLTLLSGTAIAIARASSACSDPAAAVAGGDAAAVPDPSATTTTAPPAGEDGGATSDSAAPDGAASDSGAGPDTGPGANKDAGADAADSGRDPCVLAPATMTLGAVTATRCSFDVPPTSSSTSTSSPQTHQVAVAGPSTIYVVSTPASDTNATFTRDLRRYTRQAGPGCDYRLDTSFTSPISANALFSASIGSSGTGDVDVLYFNAGTLSVRQLAPVTAVCTPSTFGWYSYSTIGVTSARRVLLPGSWASATPGTLVDPATCAQAPFPVPPDAGLKPQNAAGAHGADLLIGYEDTTIERRTVTGALVWSGGKNGFERTPVRCGSNVCVFDTSARGHVLAGATGVTGAAFNMSGIAGPDAISFAPWGNANGDGVFVSTLRPAASATCANKTYFELWEVKGL